MYRCGANPAIVARCAAAGVLSWRQALRHSVFTDQRDVALYLTVPAGAPALAPSDGGGVERNGGGVGWETGGAGVEVRAVGGAAAARAAGGAAGGVGAATYTLAFAPGAAALLGLAESSSLAFDANAAQNTSVPAAAASPDAVPCVTVTALFNTSLSGIGTGGPDATGSRAARWSLVAGPERLQRLPPSLPTKYAKVGTFFVDPNRILMLQTFAIPFSELVPPGVDVTALAAVRFQFGCGSGGANGGCAFVVDNIAVRLDN